MDMNKLPAGGQQQATPRLAQADPQRPVQLPQTAAG